MKASAERFKALLIDWDGTLIDSLPLKIENAAVLLAEHLDVSPEEVIASYRRHSGVPRRVLFDRIADDCTGRPLGDSEFERLSRSFTERNRARVAAEGRLRAGVGPVLSRLSEKGVLLFISTSAAQDEIDALAQHFEIDGICTGIFGSRPSFSKGPDHAHHVMETFGLDSREIAGIGDDVHDMVLFREAGIFAIGITGTRSRSELVDAGASRVVDEIEEVIALVG